MDQKLKLCKKNHLSKIPPKFDSIWSGGFGEEGIPLIIL